MNKKLFLVLATVYILYAVAANAQNFVPILPTDTREDIIKKAAQVKPSARQLRWQQLELTAFFHFGINTFSNLEWGTGKEPASLFNPVKLDAMQWVKTMKEAGFRQVILTAKHHDGFCLWPTATTTYSIAQSPYKQGKGDIVKEVAAACKKYQVGFGVYLSPWDRNAPVYGDSVKYNDFFTAQLTELLTRYGTIDELWFDGANGEGPNGKKQWYDFNRWYQLIRKLQPAAVIAVMGPDVRWVGTETGIGRLTEWSVLPLNAASQKEIAENSQQEVNVKPAITGSFKDSVRGSREQLYSARGLVWYPAETDVSIRPGWFYHPAENSKVKSPENLMHIYLTSVGRNGVLLLNVPPDTEGLINAADVKALEGWKQLFDNTFTKNLLQNARFQNKKGASVAGFTDGKLSTYVTTQQVTALLPAQISFNLIKLQENIALGQHIEQFTVEAWIDGSWQTIAEGTTVGYKRLLKLNKTITTNKIRFSIPATRATPAIAELGLYTAAFD